MKYAMNILVIPLSYIIHFYLVTLVELAPLSLCLEMRDS